ncbi:MMPL family transporter [Nocardioides sp. ChNu-153]|uniref:MMPL family transporter n=1 Tax=unclassified Nocardioides TaxID=2615069 RepID=UPI0024074E45|nr:MULTISPECIES: MMPL family transporter [unclassified Nocardioides]MDF9717981.1 MMPL family transporter [Nocardioides sp. ChNu-99]MDN7121612.1 MMPL family transporter [Nocardioides sp. ChNu-153]
MAILLHRLGRTAFRRWPIFLGVWVVALVAVGATALAIAKPTTSAFTIPGIPSERASELQQELFPDAEDALNDTSVTVVVAAPEGSTLTDEPYADRIAQLVQDLSESPQVLSSEEAPILDPTTAAAAQEEALVAGGATPEDVANLAPVDPDGRVGLITLEFDVDEPTDIEPASQEAIMELADEASGDGLQVEANGPGLQLMEISGASELIGIAVALVVLVLTFGSLVAAGLPIVTAIVGVALTSLGVTGMTAFTDVSDMTPILAVMIGLAVGIDYALFILARYRSELQHTDDREEAAGVAVGTAGSAVVFAGLTVLIALAALAVVRIPFLTAMGLAAATGVFLAVLVALTLLPAVLGMLKGKAFGGVVRRYDPKRDASGRVLNNGVRWARTVGRSPVAAVLLVVVALGALAIPAKDLQLALPSDSTSPSDTTQRQASDLITEAFGEGRQAPLLVVVDGRDIEDDTARQEAFGEVVAWAAEKDDVAHAQITGTNAAPEADPATATGATVLVTPASSAEDVATTDLLADMRATQGDLEDSTGTEVGVTGMTAIAVDVSDRLNDALPIYLLVVIGLAFLLLVLVFRSLLVPLTATLGFLLTVLATLGITVLVFQEGALGLIEGQPLVSFMPIFLVGVVFGLAMDYQVFLVTRIREAHVHGADAVAAVVDGFRNSARVVAAAAVIMMSVFAAFMLMDASFIKAMGFALATAVFIDAFVVRMTLIPALMYLMGDKAWWLPGWIDRFLPRVDVEGESLERAHARHDDDRHEREHQTAGA